MIENKYILAMIETAKIWAKLSYCKRLQVGAVLAKDNRILATGYNGTVHGSENICECYEVFESIEDASKQYYLKKTVECPICKGTGKISLKGTPYDEDCDKCNGIGILKYIDKTNELTVHAEQNVISFCAKNGISTDGGELYLTHAPCKQCSKLIIQSGIKEIYYEEDYRNKDGIEFLKKNRIKVSKYENKRS